MQNMLILNVTFFYLDLPCYGSQIGIKKTTSTTTQRTQTTLTAANDE